MFTFNVLGAGLVATPSPGSIIAVLAMTPKGGYAAVLSGILVSTAVSFLIAAVFVKQASTKQDDSKLEESRIKVKNLKGTQVKRAVTKVIFACDAGMGSSAMGATMLRNKFQKAGLNIEVVNCAIDAIPADAQIVITHEKLAARAKAKSPHAEHILVPDFIENHVFELLSERLTAIKTSVIEEVSADVADNVVLRKSNILLGLESMERDEAIRMAGRLLYQGGYVNEEYIEAMIERENDLTTYIGKGIAIPHGVGKAKDNIRNSGMVVLQFPEGVSFGEGKAYLVIGIAGVGNEHLSILSNIATAVNAEDDSMVEVLRTTTDSEYLYQLFYSQN
ncbi:mannitol/fructose-specific phosphotransferase system IIA component/galactitol-specific phosphotransferase system IIB component [Sporomusaceae bacterium BoRhaA]|nr:mannitol/fructose-specific phosphotransferase system IIA component/galactitol-specific phosphotransferase system IIB component [Pelorhabdus rhamnosifermentans]